MNLIDGYYVDDYGNLIPVGERDPYNEMDAIVDDLNEASVGVEGGANADIQQLVNFNKIQQQRDAAEAMPVDINPASVRRGDAKLGAWATCTAAASPILNEVVRWQGNPIESRVCSIAAGYPLQAQSAAGVITRQTGTAANRAFGRITWGVRDFIQQREFDIGKGVQFSVVASRVTVAVGLDLLSGSTGAIDVGACLGFGGGAGSSAVVTRTIYAPVAASGSVNYIIPAGARTLLPPQASYASAGSANATPPSGSAFQLDFYDINSNYLYSLYGRDSAYSFSGGSIPLSDDAYSVQVLNKDTTVAPQATFTVRLIFQIDLGG